MRVLGDFNNRIFRSQQGSILLYVVWTIILLSLFAVSISSQALFALDLTDNLSERLRSLYIAKGAVKYAAIELSRDETPNVDTYAETWMNQPTYFHNHPLGAGSFSIKSIDPGLLGGTRYGLTDEERFLNLNTTPESVLQRFFQFVGLISEAEATELVAAIQDWIDEDTKQRPLGAEGSYYRTSGYDCKDGPFENIEELLLVRGVTPQLYIQVKPYLTVRGSGFVNFNTAHPMVFRAIGLSEIGIAGVQAFRSGEDGVEGTPDDRWLTSTSLIAGELAAYVPVEELSWLSDPEVVGMFTVVSTEFRMIIEAKTHKAGGLVRVACTINRDGDITLWSEL